jgi:hypothetical protein
MRRRLVVIFVHSTLTERDSIGSFQFCCADDVAVLANCVRAITGHGAIGHDTDAGSGASIELAITGKASGRPVM